MCQCREELPFGISLKRWAVVDDRIVSLLDGSFVDSDLIAQLLKRIEFQLLSDKIQEMDFYRFII